MPELIQALHPNPDKKGPRMSREKYDQVRDAILKVIGDHGTVRFVDLGTFVGTRLPEEFEGSIGWYTISVKLDLEARGEIVRASQDGMQILRLGARN